MQKSENVTQKTNENNNNLGIFFFFKEFCDVLVYCEQRRSGGCWLGN